MKKQLSKISIIIPVYNVEKYLHRCLDSVLNQTFHDWTAICVDDGSFDNSGKILDNYAKKDKRFIVIHKKNSGSSDARNFGVSYAKSEYILFFLPRESDIICFRTIQDESVIFKELFHAGRIFKL